MDSQLRFVALESYLHGFSIINGIDDFLCQILFQSYEDNLNYKNNASKLLEDFGSTGVKQVCQYQFKKHDIVWICKSCQADETCVLCNDCFSDSKHEGHDVYFYHSLSGGCCDCGDETAWNKDGFCTKHGHSPCENPEDLIPKEISDAAKNLFNLLAENVLLFWKDYHNYCIKSEEQFLSIDRVDSKMTYRFCILNDDHHTFDVVHHTLLKVGISLADIEPLTNSIHDNGEAKIKEGYWDETFENAIHALTVGLRVCIIPQPSIYDQRLQAMIKSLEWLGKVANASDGFCRMICDAFSTRLSGLLCVDSFLPKSISKKFHTFMLTIMSDMKFKMDLAKSYADSYINIAENYSKGIGTSDNALFSLSVQFLNRDFYVNEMIEFHNFLPNLTKALSDMLDSSIAFRDESNEESESIAIYHRRYIPIIADMKIIFTIPEMSRKYLSFCLENFLDILNRFQGMHPQRRQLGQHVEIEYLTWMHAFNLHLSFSSLFEYFFHWFDKDNACEDVEVNGIHFPSVRTFAMKVLSYINKWQDGMNHRNLRDDNPNSNHETPTIRVIKCIENKFSTTLSSEQEFSIHVPLPNHSFHYLLHRLYSSIIRESLDYPSHVTSLFQHFQDLRDHLSPQTLDIILYCLSVSSEVKSNMWILNGNVMFDQNINYSDPPFSKMYRNLDVLFVQLHMLNCSSTLVINHILHRFSILELVRSYKTIKSTRGLGYKNSLLNEALKLLIHIVSEIPCEPHEKILDRLSPIIRKAAIHRLATSSCSFSELIDSINMVCDTSKISNESIDNILRDVCESRECSGLEAKKYVLKPQCWDEYDTGYPFISSNKHEKIFEMRPPIKSTQCIVPCYPSHEKKHHPLFKHLQFDVTTDIILLDLIGGIFIKYSCSLRRESNKSNEDTEMIRLCDVVNGWDIGINHSLILKSLQLFSIAISSMLYVLDHSDTESTHTELESRQFTHIATVSKFLLNEEVINVQRPSDDSVLVEEESISIKLPSIVCALLDILEFFPGIDSKTCKEKHWITWIINNLEKLSNDLKSFIQSRIQTKRNAERMKLLEKKKLQARNRALQFVKNSADKFAAHIALNEETVSDEEAEKEVIEKDEDGIPQCIICLSHDSSDTLGYLALSQASKMFHPSSDKSNLHISFCGHFMHYKCFDAFLAATVSNYQVSLFYDSDKGQYQCPLCKTINNILIPYIPTTCTITRRKRERSSDALCISNNSLMESRSDDSLVAWVISESKKVNNETINDMLFDVRDCTVDPTLHGTVMDLNKEIFLNLMPRSESLMVPPCLRASQCLIVPHDENEIDQVIDGGPSPGLRPESNNRHHTSLALMLHRIFHAPRQFVADNWNLSAPANSNDITSNESVDASNVTTTVRNNVHDILYYDDCDEDDEDEEDEDEVESIEQSDEFMPIEPMKLEANDEDADELTDEYFDDADEKSRELDDELTTKKIFWQRFLKDLSLPLNSTETDTSRPIGNISSGAQAISHLSKEFYDAIHALAFTLSICMIEDRICASDAKQSITSTSSNKEEYQPYISTLKSIGQAMVDFDVFTIISNNLDISLLAISRFSTNSSDESMRWFSNPLLSLSQFDSFLILLIFSFQDKFSSDKVISKQDKIDFWRPCQCICIAYLVQLVLLAFISNEDIDLPWEEDTRSIPGEYQTFLSSIVYIVQSQFDSNVTLHYSLSNLFTRWIRFCEGILFTVSKLHPQLLDDVDVQIIDTLDLTRISYLLKLLFLEEKIMKMNSDNIYDMEVCPLIFLWLNDLNIPKSSLISHSHLTSILEFPIMTTPSFTSLPNAYTNLHSRVTSIYDFEIPAICLVCGQVLNAGGSGECYLHSEKCCGDYGIFFLLQDCVILLCQGERACYMPAPYLDDYGERHRNTRGKPLHLDSKRLDLLNKMWIGHSICKEVGQRRSTSSKIIRLRHY